MSRKRTYRRRKTRRGGTNSSFKDLATNVATNVATNATKGIAENIPPILDKVEQWIPTRFRPYITKYTKKITKEAILNLVDEIKKNPTKSFVAGLAAGYVGAKFSPKQAIKLLITLAALSAGYSYLPANMKALINNALNDFKEYSNKINTELGSGMNIG